MPRKRRIGFFTVYVKFSDSGHHPREVGSRHGVRGQRGGRGAAKAARLSGHLERQDPDQKIRRARGLPQAETPTPTTANVRARQR